MSFVSRVLQGCMMEGSQLLLVLFIENCRLLLEDSPHYFDRTYSCRAVHGVKKRVFAP